MITSDTFSIESLKRGGQRLSDVLFATKPTYNRYMSNAGNALEKPLSETTLKGDTISVRLQHITNELREIHQSLTSSEQADPRILTDFRDALNRVRNTAWAVEQLANSKMSQTDPMSVVSVLAGERVRVTYQLCKLVMSDLSNEEIRFKLGQVMELHEVVEQLEKKLAEAITG
jgi:hypothetical protein